MTRELLESKRGVLEDLERSELEAQRLEKALERVRIVGEDGGTERAIVEPVAPSAPVARRSGGGLLGALSHTFHGIVDVDPESTRRNSIGKTRESISEVRPPVLWSLAEGGADAVISWTRRSRLSLPTSSSLRRRSRPTSIGSSGRRSRTSRRCALISPSSTASGLRRCVPFSSFRVRSGADGGCVGRILRCGRRRRRRLRRLRRIRARSSVWMGCRRGRLSTL